MTAWALFADIFSKEWPVQYASFLPGILCRLRSTGIISVQLEIASALCSHPKGQKFAPRLISLSCNLMARRKLFNPTSKLQPRPASQPAKQGGQNLASAQLTVHHESRSGPLPDPDTLKEYELILPKAADRIFTLAERDQSFAHSYNFNEQKARVFATTLGQIFGFVLGLTGIVGAVILAIYGKEFGGIGLFLGSVGTLIATAVWGRSSPTRKTNSGQKS